MRALLAGSRLAEEMPKVAEHTPTLTGFRATHRRESVPDSQLTRDSCLPDLGRAEETLNLKGRKVPWDFRSELGSKGLFHA